jgi:hypothetical protein
MPDTDTTSPYDDEVVDPYVGDDVKSPHEPVSGSEAPSAGASPRKAGRPRKTTKTT